MTSLLLSSRFNKASILVSTYEPSYQAIIVLLPSWGFELIENIVGYVL